MPDQQPLKLFTTAVGKPAVSPHRDAQQAPFPSATQLLSTSFRPALEVDHFSLSPICKALCQQSATIATPLIEALLNASKKGKRVTLLTSGSVQSGRTTTGIWLATTLAKMGKRVCLIDADIRHPDMAKQLGIEPFAGWQTYAEEEQCLTEFLIESIHDRFAVLPWTEKSTPTRWSSDWDLASILENLRDYYEVVLVDAMPLEQAGLGLEMLQNWGPFIDAALWIETSTGDTMWADRQLRSAGIQMLGQVQRSRVIAQAA